MGNNLGGRSAVGNLKPTGTIILGKRSVFCIGDMHGDAHALAKTLAMTGCVAIPEDVHTATRKCPHGNDVDLDAVRWKEGCDDVVMFLGDLLDNRRSAMDDSHGVCATPRTQFAMMDVLVRLKGEAQAHGGDVVLILGNHDVENAIDHRGTGSEEMADFFCNMHAPAVQDDGDGEYRVCGAAGFSEQHRAKVLPRLAALSGFQVVRRVKGESHSVLCMHGGLSPELPRIVGLRPGEVEENLERVNGLFVRALRDNALDARRVILSIGTGEKLPTWCRPEYVDDSKGLETYFWEHAHREGARRSDGGGELQRGLGRATAASGAERPVRGERDVPHRRGNVAVLQHVPWNCCAVHGAPAVRGGRGGAPGHFGGARVPRERQ